MPKPRLLGGKPLMIGGKVALSDDCCCGGGPPHGCPCPAPPGPGTEDAATCIYAQLIDGTVCPNFYDNEFGAIVSVQDGNGCGSFSIYGAGPRPIFSFGNYQFISGVEWCESDCMITTSCGGGGEAGCDIWLGLRIEDIIINTGRYFTVAVYDPDVQCWKVYIANQSLGCSFAADGDNVISCTSNSVTLSNKITVADCGTNNVIDDPTGLVGSVIAIAYGGTLTLSW